MRQKNIEELHRRRKREALRGVLWFWILQGAVCLLFAWLCLRPELPRWASLLFAAIAIVSLIPCVFSVKILKDRFQEIEGGESDVAGQY